MSVTSGSFSVSDTPAIEKLENTIIELNAATEKQTVKMICLTRAITVMTLVMVVGVGVQIWISLR